MWQTTQSQQDSILGPLLKYLGLPRWLSSKQPTCSAGDAGDLGSIPGWRRAWQPTPVFLPGESHAMDRRAWWAIVHRVAESDTTEATEHASCTC